MSKIPQSQNTDIYQTPPVAVKPLLKYIPKDMLIWECAAGAGLLVNELTNQKYDVIGTDILTGTDFLDTAQHINNYDCIITNPPYSLKNEFIEMVYRLNKPFALLLPLTALETNFRQNLYKNGLQLIVLNRRINFYAYDESNNTYTIGKSSAWFPSGWFTNGLNLPKDLIFEEIDKSIQDILPANI